MSGSVANQASAIPASMVLCAGTQCPLRVLKTSQFGYRVAQYFRKECESDRENPVVGYLHGHPRIQNATVHLDSSYCLYSPEWLKVECEIVAVGAHEGA